MQAVEVNAQLRGHEIVLSEEAKARLPASGAARVIVLFGDDPEDAAWREAAHTEFLRDDSDEDSVYDGLR